MAGRIGCEYDFSLAPHTEYTAKNLTKHTGLVNLRKSAEKIGLPGILEKRLSIKRGATADFEISGVVMVLMMGVLAEAKHMSHLLILKAENNLRSPLRYSWYI